MDSEDVEHTEEPDGPAEPSLLARIVEILDRCIPPEDDFQFREVAEKALSEIAQDPALYEEWQRYAVLEQLLNVARGVSRARRGRAYQRKKPEKFRGALDAAAGGDTSKLTVFRQEFKVDEANTHRIVANMTGADHQYVSGQYQSKGQTCLMEAAFHRAVAKKVGNKTTAEIISEEDYVRLHDSIAQRLIEKAA